MIELNKNQQRRPFGGHHFPESGMVLRADNFDALVGKVTEIRLINGHPVGNPSQEILRYYAEHFPYMVKSGSSLDEPMVASDYTRWRDWIRYAWYKPPQKLVTKKEASMRWDKCLACPLNKKPDWKETQESAEFARRSFLLRLGQDIPDGLGFCACHRWDSGVAVFINEPDKYSNKGEKVSQPAECFVEFGR